MNVRSFFRAVFVENIGLKLVSLVASIAIYIVIHGADDAQKTIYVDVISTLPDASSGRMLVSDLPVRVRVTLIGSPALLNGIRQGDVPPIELDLRDVRRESYDINPVDVDLPAGVTVQAIDPAAIDLTWVPRTERRVRIRPVLAGNARTGTMLVEPVRIEPESVTLVGPKDVIDALSVLETTEIDVGSLPLGRTERRVRLALLPQHVLIEGEATATVSLEVVPERAERTLPRLTVGTIGLSARSIRPTAVTVVLSGPPGAVESVEPEHVLPFVDAAPLRGERTPQMIRVRVGGLPEGVEVERVSPPEVLVTPG